LTSYHLVSYHEQNLKIPDIIRIEIYYFNELLLIMNNIFIYNIMKSSNTRDLLVLIFAFIIGIFAANTVLYYFGTKMRIDIFGSLVLSIGLYFFVRLLL
jgi:hypothetical protein